MPANVTTGQWSTRCFPSSQGYRPIKSIWPSTCDTCGAEAGLSWPTVLRLAAPRTGCLYIKDARWQGTRTNQLENVPLGKGFVDRDMFAAARTACPAVPVSLHVEYHGGKPLEGDALTQAIGSYQNDTRLLREWMSETKK